MTHYIKNGSVYSVASDDSLDIHDVLPVGTYTVKYDPNRGIFYLEMVENFNIKGKIYGDTVRVTERILSTFESRPKSTGVLLSGEKGSGKTLQAQMLSKAAQEQGIPTIVINQPWCGEEFNGFMQTIEQATVVIFDEFEKVYDREKQELMLTLLDGVYPSKKLFVLTCNDKYRVDEHMRNRPGRIFYRIDYKGLDKDFITEYCEDNLINKDHIPAICRIAVAFSEFNFDILKALVEEMNRYDESPHDVLKMLNARPEYSESVSYDATLFVDGKNVLGEGQTWRGNPLSGSIYLNYPSANSSSGPSDPFEDVDEGWAMATFDVSHLKSVDAATGAFIFQNAIGHRLSLIKSQLPTFEWGVV